MPARRRALGRMGSLIVSLTGGEPFLRPDLPEIVRAAGRPPLPAADDPRLAGHARASARGLVRRGSRRASVRCDHADAEPPRRPRGRGRRARAGGRRRWRRCRRERAALAAGEREAAGCVAGDAAPSRGCSSSPGGTGASVNVEPAFPVARGESRRPRALLRR